MVFKNINVVFSLCFYFFDFFFQVSALSFYLFYIFFFLVSYVFSMHYLMCYFSFSCFLIVLNVLVHQVNVTEVEGSVEIEQ